MSEPFLGQIQIFGFNFAPRGWAMCNGQILPIAQNTALFALLGTTYGGNGQTTFALPNLQSRVPVHFGQGPGLSSYDLGQAAGTETDTLTINNLPAHTHPLTPRGQAATSGDGNTQEPDGAYPAKSLGVDMYSNSTDGSHLAADPTGATQTGITGGSQPFSILQPYLALNFCIALEGIFPSRN
ncbi:MAG TPA: tail fiber protein [Blastocatellia bacterium]|jgi:microcystin-dependent protein|nr:tail fiber protein [Blastocatellia bacterium]